MARKTESDGNQAWQELGDNGLEEKRLAEHLCPVGETSMFFTFSTERGRDGLGATNERRTGQFCAGRERTSGGVTPYVWRMPHVRGDGGART
ncbi:MAG: hypothetical protein KBD21_03010 [Candidatus Pacebacteria bacterium]|nr:hypothetical protein [Candidatus Paceibacterota bacterium]